MSMNEALAYLVKADDPKFDLITTTWASALAMQSSVTHRRMILCHEQSCDRRHIRTSVQALQMYLLGIEKKATLRATAQVDAALVREVQRLDAMLAQMFHPTH